MKFSQPTRLEMNKRRRNCLGNWKVGGIDFAEFSSTARNFLRIVLQGPVDIGCVAGQWAISSTDLGVGHGAVEDVRVRRWEVCKDRGINPKVLRNNVLWSMCEPVVYHEGCPIGILLVIAKRAVQRRLPDFVEVRIIKDKQIFVLIVQPLNGMSCAFWEVPYIPIVQLCNFVIAVLVDGGHLN
jgi:hypothetical protein